jgi:hypothetical protein
MNNKLKSELWFWSCLVLIIVLYGSFMAYICIAKSSEPNNVVIGQQNKAEASTEESKTPKQKEGDITEYQELGKDKINDKKTGEVESIGPEVFLCEITAFYERVITILSIIIGLILGLNFLYIHHTSRPYTSVTS